MVCLLLSRVLIIASFPFICLGQVRRPRGNCGKSSIPLTFSGLVIGGKESQQGAWPWMAAIMKRNNSGIVVPWCTGFLIDKKHILSAAHCFDGAPTSDFSARIGHVDLTLADLYAITRIAIPDGYTVGKLYDDIALITLSKDVDVPMFNPVCLPPPNTLRVLTGKGTTVVGWGSSALNGPMSMTLKELNEIPVVPNAVCEQAYRGGRFDHVLPKGVTPGMICAGFQNEAGKDSCLGDSGGPLMIKEVHKWYAVGIVSFGYSCGSPDYPGVYTRVSNHFNWINTQKSLEQDGTITRVTPVYRPTVNPSVRGDNVCGRTLTRSFKHKHVFLDYAKQGEWPWMVSITKRRRTRETFCSGFLIDRKHVISVANCIGNYRKYTYTARIGNVKSVLGDVYPVTSVAIHKDYKDEVSYHDVALLTLAREVDFPNFNPVCLPPKNAFRDLSQRDVTIVGWNYDAERTLKQMNMSIVSSGVCENYYTDGPLSSWIPQGMTPEMLCLRSLEPISRHSSVGNCSIDMGSILITKEQDRWFAVGVSNEVYVCRKPVLYNRVSENLDWINEQRGII